MLEQQKISEKMFYEYFLKKWQFQLLILLLQFLYIFSSLLLSYYYLYNQLSVKAFFLLLLSIEIPLNLNGFYFE